MSRKSIGVVLIVFGFLMVFAAAGIYAAYDQIDNKAGEYAETLVREFGESLDEDDGAVQYVESAPGEVPRRTLMGYDLIGEIVIPSVGIDLPVLGDWSYDLLKISPCRYSGTIEDGNLIILGHNYKSHFTPLKNVNVGDEVRIIDVNGNIYTYRVDKTETLYKTKLDDLTMTDYDLTLFTCTTGGQSRFVARCLRTD